MLYLSVTGSLHGTSVWAREMRKEWVVQRNLGKRQAKSADGTGKSAEEPMLGKLRDNNRGNQERAGRSV